MSSGTVTTLSPTPETPVAPPTECEIVIERRIEETGRNVKGVDIAGGLITLAIGILAYLLAAAVIDHWLVVGGLGFWGRLWLWLVLVGAAGTYFVGPAAAAADESDQSAVCGRHHRAEPAVAEEQPDQFLVAPRPASGSRPDRLPGDGAPCRGRSGRRRDGRGGRSHARHPPGLRAGRGAGRVQPLPGHLAEESDPLGRAGLVALVERRSAHPGDDPRRSAGRRGRLPRRFRHRLGRGGRPARRGTGLGDLQHGRRPDDRSGRRADAARGRISLPVPTAAGQCRPTARP